MDRKNCPIVLAIMDGWGIAPPSKGNAVTLAKTPKINQLITAYPAMTLKAAGAEVGLRWGEMGNSEVGHGNLGSGKVMYQSLPLISKAVSDGSFFRNQVLLDGMKRLEKKRSFWGGRADDKGGDGNLHLMGIVSEGGVHGHSEHLYALLVMAKQLKVKNVFVHVFLDGRDAIYNSGIGFVKKLQQQMKEIKIGQIASISGRFYAMDRDNHWERTQIAYEAIVNGQAKEKFYDPMEAIQKSYDRQVYDEQFFPVVMVDKDNQPLGMVKPEDSVVFFNFRSDRARQLTKAFVLPGFDKFEREYLKDIYFVAMMEYEKDLPVEVAFAPEKSDHPFAQVISEAGFRQFHVAETEKYVHITYFFNGLQDVKFAGETRKIIPSPRVSSYDEAPEMSAKEVSKEVMNNLIAGKDDFIVVNLANPDMVGHTGNLSATIKAVEATDKCIGDIAELVLMKNGTLIITADHGNAEELINLQTGEIDKEHSTNPVPCVIVNKNFEGQNAGLLDSMGNDLSLVPPQGMISDIAPTMLKLMGINQPDEMTGRPLI